MNQYTLATTLTFQGVGLHTGANRTLTLSPAEPHSGYQICRSDLEGSPVIPAYADYVTTTQRATRIERGAVQVSTLEHCLSALYALGVDNCLITVDGDEAPILDGSAQPYVQAIQEAGLKEQSATREVFVVRKPIEVKDEETGSSILLLPSDQLGVEAHLSFASPLLSNQYASLRDLSLYGEEIAEARSFVFVREILPLLSQGLIKGGDLANAMVINDEPLSESDAKALAEALHRPVAEVSQLGVINPKEGISNEPARHKILDILGDLALAGIFVQGHIIATKPGHKINNKLARAIRKEIKGMETQPPVYDPNATPVLDLNQIKGLLPHRYPFLLVDKVIHLDKNHIVGVKNVSFNETFFLGHFPTEPVMPGVLIVEAMAQTAGLLVLSGIEDPERYSTYFLTINNVKFRNKVVPGDTLLFKVMLTSEVRRGLASVRGLTFVGNQLVCEADFMAQIVKNKE